jgi:hypothetical protein
MDRDVATIDTRSSAGAFWPAFAGALVAWLAMVSYFLVVPRWPDLRDSGVPSVVLAVAGVVLGAAGTRRSFRIGRQRALSCLLLVIGCLPAVFLALYVFVLSYRLPGPEGVLAVGERAPGFALPDQEGRERTLAELSGRQVVLVFFRGHW